MNTGAYIEPGVELGGARDGEVFADSREQSPIPELVLQGFYLGFVCL